MVNQKLNKEGVMKVKRVFVVVMMLNSLEAIWGVEKMECDEGQLSS